MPENQQQPGDQSQPTHTAAKVVIPFDIDLSEIEKKLAAIEQRLANVKSVGGMAMQEQTVDQQSRKRGDNIETGKQTTDLWHQINNVEHQFANAKAVGGAAMQERSVNQQSRERNDDLGTEKQLMMTTMMRMSDLLRQINDTVTLIYNTQMNNNG